MTKQNLVSAIEKASESLEEVQVGLKRLDSIDTKSADYRLIVDGLIKRFEILFEYTWKLLKVAAIYEGSEAPGPRMAIQEGIKYGWITAPEFWALALDARNASVHDYLTLEFDEYHKIIERFANEAKSVIDQIKKL